MKRIIHTLTLLMLLCMLAPTASQARPAEKSARLDRSFGNGGWVSDIPLPRGHAVKPTSEPTPVSGLRGSSFLILQTYKKKGVRGRTIGGVVIKYNFRGRIDRSFGRRGATWMPAGRVPVTLVELIDGSVVLATGKREKHYSVSPSSLIRLRRDGRRDRGFGIRGEIKEGRRFFVTDSNMNPRITLLTAGRFAVSFHPSSGGVDGERLVVYNSRGKPDSGFGAKGHVDFGFELNDVAVDYRGRILLSKTGDRLQVFRLNFDGSRDQSWGEDGLVTSPVLDPRQWVPKGDELWDMVTLKGLEKDTGDAIFRTANLTIRPLGHEVAISFEASLDSGSDVPKVTEVWAQRLDQYGNVIASWGKNGRYHVFHAVAYVQDADDFTDYHWSIEVLPDGRFLRNEYTYDSYFGETLSEGSYIQSNTGRPGGAGACMLRLPRSFADYGHVASRRGSRLYLTGYRRSQLRLIRMRICA